jgi:tRNA threonylcarbamoyladenosine biosynthesis protein TsaB
MDWEEHSAAEANLPRLFCCSLSGASGVEHLCWDCMAERERLLLLDTVGAAPGAVLTEHGRVIASSEFPVRSASAALLGGLKRMLRDAGFGLRELSGVGVVSGPGSFTGVRTGLATAKGLCEVTGLPLASVSRLAVLAEAAELQEGFAVLDAGRGELYVRAQRRTEAAREWLATVDEFVQAAAGAAIVVAEEKTAERLDALAPRLHSLSVIDLLAPVRRCIKAGGTDVAWVDANYVLPESEIYTRPKQQKRVAG